MVGGPAFSGALGALGAWCRPGLVRFRDDPVRRCNVLAPGNYEDVYVKTPDGWRFKTRTHTRAPNGTGHRVLRHHRGSDGLVEGVDADDSAQEDRRADVRVRVPRGQLRPARDSARRTRAGSGSASQSQLSLAALRATRERPARPNAVSAIMAGSGGALAGVMPSFAVYSRGAAATSQLYRGIRRCAAAEYSRRDS